MAFKFIVFAAMLAYAHAGAIGYAAPGVAYQAAPALHGQPLAYQAGPALHGQHLAYHSAPALHETPYNYHAAQAVHAAPVAYQTGPVAYQTAPVAYHAAPAYAPVAKTVVEKHVDQEYDPNPQYNYSYDVHDTITGDAKSQQETREGDVVHGSYSLIEADGTKRIVEYTADPHNGFNAVVHKEPAQVAVKTVAAAPVVAKVHHHAAPAVATYAAAPVQHHAYY